MAKFIMQQILFFAIACWSRVLNNPRCEDVISFHIVKSEFFGTFILSKQLNVNYLKTEVVVFIEEIPRSRFPGALQLTSSPDTYMKYKLLFPSVRSWPRIKQISVNNRTYCFSPDLKRRNFATTIKLEHTAHFAVNPESRTEVPLNTVCGLSNDGTPLYNSKLAYQQAQDEIYDDLDEHEYIKAPKREKHWPWLVAFYKKNENVLSYQCAGTLITRNAVLTVAHCFFFNSRYLRNTEVIAKTQEGYTSEIAAIFIHPDYKKTLKTYDADLAVIMLKKDIRMSNPMRPICLLSEDNLDVLEWYDKGRLCLWQLEEDGKDSKDSEIQRRPVGIHDFLVNVMKKSFCEKFSTASKRTFCASISPENVGALPGNSGTGLMIFNDNRWFLKGVLSAKFTLPERKTNSSNEYIIVNDISKFIDWIAAFML